MKKPRILIVDDQAVIREGLRLLIRDAGMTVCGEAPDGLSAVEQARAAKPDLVLMDITMPGMSGIEATEIILKELPRTKVLVLSVHKDGRFVDSALKAGASGYLLKECAYEELLAAIRAVMRDELYIARVLRPSIGPKTRRKRCHFPGHLESGIGKMKPIESLIVRSRLG